MRAEKVVDNYFVGTKNILVRNNIKDSYKNHLIKWMILFNFLVEM